MDQNKQLDHRTKRLHAEFTTSALATENSRWWTKFIRLTVPSTIPCSRNWVQARKACGGIFRCSAQPFRTCKLKWTTSSLKGMKSCCIGPLKARNKGSVSGRDAHASHRLGERHYHLPNQKRQDHRAVFRLECADLAGTIGSGERSPANRSRASAINFAGEYFRRIQ